MVAYLNLKYVVNFFFSEIHDRLLKWEGVNANNVSVGGSNSQQSGSLHSSTGMFSLYYYSFLYSTLKNEKNRYLHSIPMN